MTTLIYLTDAGADIAGYRRACIGDHGDNPSLVRAVTTLLAGPQAGIQATRAAGGEALAWLTDPLRAGDLTAAAWTLHLWAMESAAGANAGLRVQVLRFTNAEGAAVLDDVDATELPTATRDLRLTSPAATPVTLLDGDRLVIKILLHDAGGVMAAPSTATLSYGGLYPAAEGVSYLTCPDVLAPLATFPVQAIADIRLQLRDVDSATALFTDAELVDSFGLALRQYQRDRPRHVVEALDGDGLSWEYSLPRHWVHGLSALETIEYPTGTQYQRFVDQNEWQIVESSLGGQPTRALRFTTIVPDLGTANILLSYVTRHVHTDQLSTIPADDYPALTQLAASFAALKQAARSAGSTDSTIQADVVNHRDGEQRWRAVAKALRDSYDEHLVSTHALRPATATRDWDTNWASGQDRLFHSRRRR